MTAAEVTDSTGVPAVDTLVVWSLAAVAIAGAAATAWRIGRWLRRIAVRVDEFVDDWQGVPGRPGVPERPGVMTRLDRIEGRIGRVEHELQPNSGHSLRDAVNRIDHRTQTLAPDSDT
ncbi:hypothetical protein BX257_4725 [Streptomyces sp. 3212.3]|uniref:hypothetical protein n=1 Tax=Streptomyces sp. 3212.3 TaxID=1938846 RepID=UPI000E21C777|nr:hypothetical protein [Streptomyces sp. 3212.3]REE62112.1 hypothetical protein BX257_4725 [Streptomyces sp. 3212.3]